MNNPGMPSNVPDFVTSHLRQYLDTGGEEGHLWDSTGLGDHGEIPTLLLTTYREKIRTSNRYSADLRQGG